jgi:hypothetical protein
MKIGTILKALRRGRSVAVQELIETYGYWGEHPRYTFREWKTVIVESVCPSDYWRWVAARLEPR